ncbi:porin [Pseudoduganella sp. OTU4001]|uniref:porin n=1 Tax=Pseudoduganella sp. OTU4001 TaxID=3043854 RepID=UPI00313B6100
MKRLAIAVLALASGAHAAWAQQGVTVYGVADLGVVRDTDSGITTMKVDSGLQTASRLGFKGNEALGGGMSASFVIESQIEADTGTPSFGSKVFGSQVWVGLSGPLGAVKLGRMFTPYFGAIATNDPFDAKGPGEATRLFQDSGVRMDNTIKFSLPPSLGGFYADLAYGFGESGVGHSANRQVSMDAGYAAGPLNAVLAYHQTNDGQGRKLVRSVLAGGNYDFGKVRGWLLVARNRNGSTLDTRDYLLGLTFPFGMNTLAATYVRKQDQLQSNADARQLALGYYYTLSKRTNTYLIASDLRNDALAHYQATRLGGDRRLLACGMRHQF